MFAVYLRFDRQYAEALSVNKHALKKTLSLGDRFNSGQVLVQMAVLANVLEDYVNSREYASEAYQYFHSIGGEYQLPFPLRLQGYAALHTGDVESARAYCVDSVKRNYALGGIHEVGVIAGLLLLAEIEQVSGNLDLVRRLFTYVVNKRRELSLSIQEPDDNSLARLNCQFSENIQTDNPSVNILDVEEILFGSKSI